MKDSFVADLFKKVIDTPAMADQLRKYLVNRDIAIEIDGQKFQLTRRRPDQEDMELEELREHKKNLRKVLKQLITAVEDLAQRDSWLNEALADAKRVLRDN